MIADDGDKVVEHDDLLHPRNLPGCAVIDTPDFAAEHGTPAKGRKFHSGQHRVDALDHLAVGFVGSVETLERLADEREILWILARRILRDG